MGQQANPGAPGNAAFNDKKNGPPTGAFPSDPNAVMDDYSGIFNAQNNPQMPPGLQAQGAGYFNQQAASSNPNDQVGGPELVRAMMNAGAIPGQTQSMAEMYGGAAPPGFDPGGGEGTWADMTARFADPYTAYYGGSSPADLQGGAAPVPEPSPVAQGAPAQAGTTPDFSQDAQAVEQATFDRLRNLLDPVFSRQESDMNNRLSVQGLPTGGEAYGRAYDTFNQSRNQAYENAALQAVNMGRGEQGRMFNQMMDYTNLAAGLRGQEAALSNAGRASAINEALMLRQLPQQELSALLGLTPATPYPQFQSGGGYAVQAPDIMGAMNAQANRNAAAGNNILSTAGMLGAAAISNPAIMASSREFKDPIAQIDPDSAIRAVQSLNVERWRYKGESQEHIGPYAEDFHAATNLGNDKEISIIDAIGLLTSAVKGIADRMDLMERANG